MARPFIEAANPTHPSLIDIHHEMDAKFGVVNIPNGVWIDEAGVIVRPAEPAWSGGERRSPQTDPNDSAATRRMERMRAILATRITIDRDRYAAAIRDWADHGSASRFILPPEEVIARSHPRPPEVAQAAAHFELAEHLWRLGQRESALDHFKEAHRLQPDNWTYKRQAWSLVSAETFPGPRARFMQGPPEGHESDWPFESDFLADVEKLGPDEYYPPTI